MEKRHIIPVTTHTTQRSLPTPPSSHYSHHPAVTTHTTQRSLPTPPSGHYPHYNNVHMLCTYTHTILELAQLSSPNTGSIILHVVWFVRCLLTHSLDMYQPEKLFPCSHCWVLEGSTGKGRIVCV